MTDHASPTAPASPEAPISAERLAAFRSEVETLKVTGGVAKLERWGATLGLIGAVVGVVIAFIAYSNAQSAGDFATIHRNQIFAALGVAIALIGMLAWLRNSITRHLRWWMVRNIHEQRQQTDRIIEALNNK